MKLFSITILYGLSSLSVTLAAQSFSASNIYYAAGLTDSQSTTLLARLQSAGVKVLRVWLDGMIFAHISLSDSSLTNTIGQSGSVKGTPIESFNRLQGSSPSDWDDTVLNRLDIFMVKANSYGIKLLISIHSYNALEAANDFYGQWDGTGDFYTDGNAIQYFKERIAHVLAHVNLLMARLGAKAQSTFLRSRLRMKRCVIRYDFHYKNCSYPI